MKQIMKDSYVAPEIFLVELVSECIVCTSGSPQTTGDRNDYGNPVDQNW